MAQHQSAQGHHEGQSNSRQGQQRRDSGHRGQPSRERGHHREGPQGSYGHIGSGPQSGYGHSDYCSQRGYGRSDYSPQSGYSHSGYSPQGSQGRDSYHSQSSSGHGDYGPRSGQGPAGYNQPTRDELQSSYGHLGGYYHQSGPDPQHDRSAPGSYGDQSRYGYSPSRQEYPEPGHGYAGSQRDFADWNQRSGWNPGGSSQDHGTSDWESGSGQKRSRGPKGYKRSDERIREDVCERLGSQGQVDASEVEVRVQDGEVTAGQASPGGPCRSRAGSPRNR